MKAFLKAGIMNERGDLEETRTVTPARRHPLAAARRYPSLSALYRQFARASQAMGSGTQRHRRALRGEATYRLVRYVNDFSSSASLASGQLELAVVEYIGWYNATRLHESLGDIPPLDEQMQQAQRPITLAGAMV